MVNRSDLVNQIVGILKPSLEGKVYTLLEGLHGCGKSLAANTTWSMLSSATRFAKSCRSTRAETQSG